MKRIRLLIIMSAICIMAADTITSYASESDYSGTVFTDTETPDLTSNKASDVTVEGTVGTSEYTTIQINAEDDGDGPLLYAIDSDLPEAFQTSNEFTVLRGSEHTVYVKDASGKISAQVYKVPVAEVDMEVNIGYSDTSSISQLTDEEMEAVENGGGTTAEKVVTDNSDTSERVFYTITTKDEHVFYMVIDQSRGENNVYLLDQVTDQDLYALTGSSADTGKGLSNAKEDTASLTEQEASGESADTQEKKSSAGDFLLYGILILLIAGAVYYYKIYKPKQAGKQELDDARDLDEFEPDEDPKDVLDFAVSKEEKEAVLREIVNKSDFDDDELMYDPDTEEEKSEEEDASLPEDISHEGETSEMDDEESDEESDEELDGEDSDYE